MKENKINFSNFNLVVDFLRFNLQFTEKSKIQQVAQYLFDEYWCATFFKDSHTGKFYPIRKNRQFRCKAKFITSHTSHWCGTRVEFDGMSASIFYQMIKDKPLDWKRMDLDSTNIGRIDLYYDRHFQETDRGEDYDKFLTETHAILSSRQPSLKVESKSQSLAIGDRKTSPNYFRIYKKSNGRSIRFELEIKLKLAKNFQFFLFAGQFETLELKLVQHYYSYLITKFEIQGSSYTNWILENFRNIRLL